MPLIEPGPAARSVAVAYVSDSTLGAWVEAAAAAASAALIHVRDDELSEVIDPAAYPVVVSEQLERVLALATDVRFAAVCWLVLAAGDAGPGLPNVWCIGPAPTPSELAGRLELLLTLQRARQSHPPALREAERSRWLLEQTERLTASGSWDWNFQTGETFWSPQLHTIYGRSVEEGPPPAHTYLERVHPDDRERLERAVEGAIGGERFYRVTYRLRRYGDDALRTLAAEGETFFDDQGEPERLVGCVRDITDEARAKDELERSEARYRAIVDNIDEGVAVFAGFERLYFNDRLASMLGFTPEVYARTDFFNLIHPEDKAMAARELSAVMSGASVEAEVRAQNASGAWRRFRARGRPVVWEGRSALVAFVADITEQHEARESLRLKNRVFESSIAGHAVLDRERGITEINGAALAMFGFTDGSEAKGLDFASLIEEPDPRELFGLLDAQSHWHGRVRAVRRGGGHFIGELGISSYRGSHAVSGYQWTLFDLSKRVEAEAGAAREQARFRALVDASAVGIAIVDIATRRFVYANRSLRQALGYAEGEFERLQIRDIHADPARARAHEALLDTMEAPPPIAREVYCKRRDGTRWVVDISASLLEFDGRPSVVGFFHDVADRRQAQELALEAEALKTLNEAMLGREARIIELKEEVNALAAAQGLSPPYPPIWEEFGAKVDPS